MNPAEIQDVMREAIIVSLKISAPMLMAALIVGLVVSLVQALTQLQEMTLAFVPKIVVTFAAFLVFLPFIMATLVTFTQDLAVRIIGSG
ncbi:MAG: flagellar biosynthesis protein FliQ [Pseudomonadota bacterium]